MALHSIQGRVRKILVFHERSPAVRVDVPLPIRGASTRAADCILFSGPWLLRYQVSLSAWWLLIESLFIYDVYAWWDCLRPSPLNDNVLGT